MKYVIDSEFIDTPTCSALISFAIVREDNAYRYFEFAFPEEELTPWLREHVVPHLSGERTTFAEAAKEIERFIGADRPEVWAYFGAYDWYWFCRLWGGMMHLPPTWPHRFNEVAHVALPEPAAVPHNALSDCHAILRALKKAS